MRKIELSKRLIIIAIAIVTLLFIAIISPLKGLGLFTMPILLFGIGCWLFSIILLIVGLLNKGRDNYKRTTFAITLFLIIGFIPLGYFFMKLSGDVRTKITVKVINQSDFALNNVLIYGSGNIFENPDTLKIDNFEKGKQLFYIIKPTTKPHRNGNIMIEFDLESSKRISKIIAGEFSINPYELKQYWEVNIDNAFLK